MSRIGELFAKSCVNGIYSHYNPAESPDPSTQLPVQPTKASYNFFRSSKFHFTELWANEKKSIFIFGAQTATMSLVCRRLQLRILASQDTLEGPPPWSVAEWSRSRKATLCFRIFYVAVSVCLCSCLYLSLCCFIYSVDWHDLSTATPFHRVPPQSRRARSIAAPSTTTIAK